MGRTATAILNTENLLHNLSIIKSHAPQSAIMAMIKANAYGHGLRSSALRLDGHVERFGVASIDEALALRKVGIKAKITLMEGVFEPSELLSAALENLEVVFHSKEQLSWLEKTILPVPLAAWLKVDTGMGRLGFSMSEAQAALGRLSLCHVQNPVGIMSHLACADEREHTHNIFQIERFQALVANFSGPKSLNNSAAIFNFPASNYDLVRPGLALYGVSPILGVLASDLLLKPVMTLKTSLISVRHEKKHAFVGYGGTYSCPEDMPVGIMAMGYGDGYPQKNPNNTPVLVNNTRCQVIGRVSMDMAAVDLRACPHAQVGDAVTLWGEALALEEIAHHTGRTAYDLLCAVQSRVKFYWTR